MNKEDKIIEKLKKSQYRLDEMPSSVAWQRLEARLDARKTTQKQRINNNNFVVMTAAAVLFIGFFGFLGWYFMANPTAQLAQNQPTTTSEIATNEETEEIAAVQVQPSAPPTIVTDPNQTGRATPPIASNVKTTIASPASPSPTVQAAPPAIIVEQPTTSSVPTPTKDDVPLIAHHKAPTLPSETKKEAEEDLAQENYALADEKITTTKGTTTMSSTSKPITTAPAPTATIPIDKAAPKNYDVPRNSPSSIQEFSWLIGTWTESTNNGISTEAWTWSDTKTLKAEANVNNNGKTTFKETLTIKETKSGLVLTTAIDTKKTASYALQSLQNNRAIFVNDKMDFPHQIIIQQLGNDLFSTTLVGRGNLSNESQMNYITNRNNVSPSNKEASRVLKRAN
jgi:hypothetical protein